MDHIEQSSAENELIILLKQQINELEFKQTFQEDSINQLNSALTEQQQQLMLLKHQLKLVASKINELQAQPSSETELIEPPPPHY